MDDVSTTALQQGTDEWLKARAGKATASRMSDLLARTKSGWGASRANYAAELVAERLTGEPAKMFVNDAMRRGTEKEPEARTAYELWAGVNVQEVGFVPHPTIAMSGASPDGLIDADGMIEIKCPNTATHIETLLGEPIADKYMKQVQWQLACTGRAWCDWVSYDDRLPPSMALFVKRIHRDVGMIAVMEPEVIAFLREVEDTVARLRSRYGE